MHQFAIVIWGQPPTQDAPLPLPKNPWLLRRRLGGVKYEVERLFSRFAEMRLSPQQAKDQILTFLSSEYQKNAVYYRFINMRIGIRRMAVYLLGRYLLEMQQCRKKSANSTT